jgi:two-component system chemotaxis response regulator CheY
MQILVVDDSRTMRMLVTRTLRQAGFGGHDIVEAGDGLEALDVIRSVGADIVLCDWNMPRMSGLELLQTLRGHGDKRPFGFVTSEGTPAMREVAEKEGANFVITKPFTAEIFQQVLGGVEAADSSDDARQGLPTVTHVGANDSTTMVRGDAAVLVWSYVFADGGLAAAGAVDMRLAAILGAGLGMLPQSRMSEAIDSGTLPKELEDNLREIVNILVGLYAPMSDEHVTLGGIWGKGATDIPGDVSELLACRTRRLDAVVSLAGYGQGCLSAIPAWRLVRSEVPA